ncbi:DUF805 domain-containing protein [Qipengyuania nanhaisediminis]|uniref:DUF805 domain-containing protein n=1 Tax=Qipengyuania nanhaisediminis TaxID=604088 RepID=UPI0038B30F62
MMRWILVPLLRFAQFDGRSRRAEFWMFALFQIMLFGALLLAFSVLRAFAGDSETGRFGSDLCAAAMIAAALVLSVPFVALMVRRLHDLDRSGWWCLLNLVPFGTLALLVAMTFEGDHGPNRYGADPKGGDAEHLVRA